VLLLLALGVPAARAHSQSPQDSTFEQRARVAWLASFGERDDPELPRTLATIAGLRFQARADRLTPDLDSALALAVVRAGGALRDSPWGWFAYARHLQARHGTCRPYALMPARDWFSWCRRVVGAYRRALDLDSVFAPVLADLDDAVPWPGLWLDPEPEMRLLGRAVAAPETPSWLARRLERRRLLTWVHRDATVTVAALVGSGADTILARGEAAFVRSRVEARDGDGTRAVATYLLAVGDTGPGDHQQWIRDDIALIGSDQERHEWDALAPSGRAAWMAAFWDRRDLEDGLAPGGRFVAHANRWLHAFRDYQYLLEDARLRGGGSFTAETRNCPLDTAIDAETGTLDPAVLMLQCNYADSLVRVRLFDDRGLTFLRHGAPQRKAKYAGDASYHSESWLYTTEDGPLVIHFGRPRTYPMTGMFAGAMPRSDTWMEACALTPRFCVLAARRSMGERIPPERMRQVVERGDEEMRELLTTDGAPQRFANAFRFNAGAYGLGTAPGSATLAVDIPLGVLRGLAGADSSRITLRWQVRIRGRDGTWPVSSDTQSTLALPSLAAAGDDALLTVVREYPLAAGEYDVRLVLSDAAGTTGAIYSRDGLTILDPGAPGLSDVILMPDGAFGAPRSVEGESVRIGPTFTAGTATTLRLGYVLTGLREESVRVRVEVTKVGDARRRPAIAVTFPERPDRDRSFRTQSLDVRQLDTGAYDLSVTLELPDGATQTRTQRMLIRGR
jgi:hypothetical protein